MRWDMCAIALTLLACAIMFYKIGIAIVNGKTDKAEKWCLMAIYIPPIGAIIASLLK
nr:MAG TPA: hypothetical protein [Caudoviricetes sp.]